MDHHAIADVFMAALADALEDHRSAPDAVDSRFHRPENPWAAHVVVMDARFANRLAPRRESLTTGWRAPGDTTVGAKARSQLP